MEFRIPEGINKDAENKWCPGCGHGIIVRLIAEAARDLDIENRIIMVEDVACGAFAKFSLQFNSIWFRTRKTNYNCCWSEESQTGSYSDSPSWRWFSVQHWN